jgi:hypothetical protein
MIASSDDDVVLVLGAVLKLGVGVAADSELGCWYYCLSFSLEEEGHTKAQCVTPEGRRAFTRGPQRTTETQE